MTYKIADNQDIQAYMGTSGMKYNTKGQMYFKDMMYLTHWKMGLSSLDSTTYFTNLETEGFAVTMDLFDREMDWNHFGFIQNFKDAQTDEIASPLHRNIHLELYYVVTGGFKIRVQDRILQLKQGQILLLNSNALHSDIFKQGLNETMILGLNEDVFNEAFLRQLENPKLVDFILQSFDTKMSDAQYMILEDYQDTQYLELLLDLEQEIKQKDTSYQVLIEILLLRLFQKISNDKLNIIESPGHGLKAIIFSEVKRYMDQNYANITLEQLSDTMKYSKDYFNRLIKEITGYTYMQYLQNIRIEKAQEYLLTTDLTVQEIAQKVGYHNTTHFYDVFRNISQQTPNEYRNKGHIA